MAENDLDRIKELARDGNPEVRARIAGRTDVPPELLYFLASDDDHDVRRAVAANRATPPQADTILAQDRDYGVRCAVARKAVGEGLGKAERKQLWRMGFTIIETLATDQVVRVRKILADAFHTSPDAPHDIVKGLARDPEAEVAVPLLEDSPVLTDDDLVEIIGEAAPDWAQDAIARRETLSSRVTEAIESAASPAAIGTMLGNRGAAITEPTLNRIVERAPEVAEWHEPLVRRPSLPKAAIRALARFVGGPLLQILKTSQTLEPETESLIEGEIAARAADGPGVDGARGRPAPVSVPAEDKAGETPEQRALRLFKAGELNDQVVSLALDSGERDFVTAALCLRAGVAVPVGRRIVASQSAKAMTALAWKAKFPMRFALDLQQRLARVPPSSLLYARDGTDYPMSAQDMTRHLELFAI